MIGKEVAPPKDAELLVVVGPTASGKTDLAIELAERLGGEVVSADSVQIYRHFDIGSGKPSPGEMARVAHHLVSELDPMDKIDAAGFAELATTRIGNIRQRGRVPIVCGGSFLWVRALIHGLAEAPPADESIRTAHKTWALEEGRAALHRRLAEVDPRAAAKLAPNDLLRVSRALEVFELTGKPQSEWHDAHGFRARRFDARFVAPLRTRDEIDERIRSRVAHWLANGWIEEAQSLIRLGYESSRALGSVGYRQVREHLEGRIAFAELEDAIVRATRIFVRRQRTWIRDEPVQYIER